MGDRRRFWWIMVREMRDEGQQRWESGPAREVCMWGAGARPGQGPQEHSRGQKQGPAKSERTQVDVRVLLGSTVTFYPGMQRPADTGQQCVGCSLGPASPPPPSGSWFSRIAANCFDWLAQECTKVSQWPGHQNKNLICATWNPATCKSHNIRAWRVGEAWWQMLLFSVLENNKRQSRVWGGWWWSLLRMAHYPASSPRHSSQYQRDSNILRDGLPELKILKYQLIFKGWCKKPLAVFCNIANV